MIAEGRADALLPGGAERAGGARADRIMRASRRSPARGATARPSWPLAIVLLVSIPALAIVLYIRLGDPGAAAVAETNVGTHEFSEQQITAMIGQLSQRLEQHPDDAAGWAL